MAVKPDLGEVLRRALESRVGEVWTSFPGEIQSYDPASRTADVIPVLRRPLPTEDDETIWEDLPILPGVRILFPQGGGYAITWPLNPGDSVLVLVTTYSVQNWVRTGAISDPGDVRPHNLGSCFAIPGAMPGTKPLDQASLPALVIDGAEIRAGKNATDFAALASLVMANFDKIKALFDGWTPVPNDGGAALKTAAASLSFDDVKASKLKVE